MLVNKEDCLIVNMVNFPLPHPRKCFPPIVDYFPIAANLEVEEKNYIKVPKWLLLPHLEKKVLSVEGIAFKGSKA